MSVYLGFHFSLSGQCPGLVGMHAGDESTLTSNFSLFVFISDSILASSLAVNSFPLEWRLPWLGLLFLHFL
jgi:hypothetical protein